MGRTWHGTRGNESHPGRIQALNSPRSSLRRAELAAFGAEFCGVLPKCKAAPFIATCKIACKIVSLRQWLVVAIALDIAIPCFGRIERKKSLKERSSPQTLKMSHLGE